MYALLFRRADEIAESMLVASWTSAIATIVGVILTAGAVIAATVAIVQTSKQMTLTARRESADSEARTRPYVSARIVVGIAGSASLDLVLENTGGSTARCLRLVPSAGRFDPESTNEVLAAALEQMFMTGFDLAPGERRRVFWHLDPVDSSLPREKQPASVRDTLSLKYEWHPDDDSQAKRKYVERVNYDMSDYVAVIPSPSQGATTFGLDNAMQLEVRNLANAVRAVGQHIGELYR